MINFIQLSPQVTQPSQASSNLWHKVEKLSTILEASGLIKSCLINGSQYYPPANLTPTSDHKEEKMQTDWLINLFNQLFQSQNVTLVHASDLGKDEPEYLPAIEENGQMQPAKICFAHGYFASALHEISHWTIAGKQRRTLNDFGYWYAPDGRDEQQQRQFEQLEVKPQAIECLFTLACGRPFQVSQDNLFAEFDTSESTFAQDVYQLAYEFLLNPNKLPKDAQTLLAVLYWLCVRMN